MDIQKAKQLKIGDRVACPADRGEPAFTGRVTFTGSGDVYKNIHGTPYIWITVKSDHNKHSGVWPSNRLG